MRKIDFNRDWTFQKNGSTKKCQVNLPHDAMLFENRSKENKSGSASAYFEGGCYTYTKDLNVDNIDNTYILEFEGVYQNAKVYLNDELLVERPYGYSNFFVDMTDRVNEGNNTITVIADNSDVPNSRWYSGSGIYREVYLYTAGKNYIKPEGIKVDGHNGKTANVSVDIVSTNDCQIKIEIMDSDQVIAVGEGSNAEIEIPNPILWSEDNPHLYTCKVSLVQDDTILDESSTNFGLRTISWGSDGFLVNGKSVLLRGACIHHDNGVIGAATFYDAEYRRVRILKEAGFNAIRSSHNPMSKAMLSACDELGIYVMDESFDMWFIKKNPYDFGGDKFKTWWKIDTKSMIDKDYNHPCVVMYSIGNEITDLGLASGQEQARIMSDYCHELDNTRPVTAGINLMLASMAGKKNSIYGTDDNGEVKDSGASGMDDLPTSEFFNILMNKMGTLMNKASSSKKANIVASQLREIFDIPGYNYASSRYKIDAKEAPTQATVGSETLPQTLYDNWQLVKEIKTMTGDFMWTGWDYLGESGIGTVKYIDKKTKLPADQGLTMTGGPGIIDITGKPRPEVGWAKLIWGLTDQVTIGVDPVDKAAYQQGLSAWRTTDAISSWSWEGFEGNKTKVTVYANADKVELLLNKKSLGKKKVKKNTAIFKNVTYEAGCLEAVALDSAGHEISRSTLDSATGKTSIQLKAEKTALKADGQSLCFLNIDLIGENGITKSSVDQELSIEVTGPGCLQGYGSARPNIPDDFVSNSHKTFLGKSLAVIRAGYEPGQITIKVSGDGLEDVSCIINVE